MEYLIGLIVGCVVTNIIIYVFSGHGVFKIDCSNPDKDVYRLEIGDIDSIHKKKRIILKIDKNADLSQN